MTERERIVQGHRMWAILLGKFKRSNAEAHYRSPVEDLGTFIHSPQFSQPHSRSSFLC
jgi:hypothetical protein